MPGGKSKSEKLRGATRDPSDPTGRLVLSNVGSKTGGTSILHFCPDANKTGEYAWKCPSCGQWFHWSVDRQQWEPADEPEAHGGL